MEKIPQALQDKLLDYLDGNLSAAEIQNLEQQLQHNPVLKAHYNALSALHMALHQEGPEQPSKDFAQAVMGKLDRYNTVPSKFSIRNGILLLAGVLIAVSITALLVSAGVFDSAIMIDLNQIDPLKKYIPQTLPSIPFNGKTVVNAIIMLNLILAWIILDRAIMRPFFQRRMQSHH